MEHISGYFDTGIGMKQEKTSYEKIIENLTLTPEEITFLTDIVKGLFILFLTSYFHQQSTNTYIIFVFLTEAEAAKSAGMNVVLLDRPGNAPLTDQDKESFKLVKNFNELKFESVGLKRKIEETDKSEVLKQIKIN